MLHANHKVFAVAGTKDKRGVTAQQVRLLERAGAAWMWQAAGCGLAAGRLALCAEVPC